MPEKQRCAAVRAKIAGSMLNSAVKMDAMPMPAEMGTPASSMTKKEPNSSNVACATIMRFLLSFPYAFYFALQLLIVSSIMESYYITPLCSATFVSNYIKSLPKFRDNCYTFMLFNYCNQAHFDIY